jgi:hypothetical protein
VKCDYLADMAGGFICRNCGQRSLTAEERECVGVQAQAMKKPCCGENKIEARKKGLQA